VHCSRPYQQRDWWPAMKYRTLGRTDMRLSEIGLGTWELSGDAWGAKDRRQSEASVLTAVDHGVNLIDTAAEYGDGRVEELLGDMISAGVLRRDRLIISTKIRPENNIFAPPVHSPIVDAFSPQWIKAELQASLARLKTDYVDVLFLHTWTRGWDHTDEWHTCLQQLKDAGTVRAFGISVPDQDPSEANTHIEGSRVDVVQAVYNMFQQEPEYTLLPLAERSGVGVIARSPFSSGSLVQDWTPETVFPAGDWRGDWAPQVQDGWLSEQVRMAGLVKPLMQPQNGGVNVAALRYILDQCNVTSVIPGSGNPDHVASNITASDVRPLDAKLRSTLSRLWKEGKVHGTYNGSA
jgi:aryl-alcohol dehydrogenase-like predicted oxidoreductase